MTVTLTPGLSLGRYVLTEPIAGSSAWLCANERREAFVLKPLPWATAAQRAHQTWFEVDAPALPRLEIQGLVSYDVLRLDGPAPGKDDEAWYLVMPLVRGTKLSERLAARDATTRDECVALGLQLARTLAALHAEGLFHNDVKAENVVLDARGFATLVDYGQPEALASERTAHWDLWCLGNLLGELSTGRPAYEGKTRPSTDDRGREYNRRRREDLLRTTFPHLSEIEDRKLRALVFDLTCGDSADHLASARDVLERITATLEGDHRMREVETGFGSLRTDMDAKAAAIDTALAGLASAQAASLQRTEAELERMRAEVEAERAALKDQAAAWQAQVTWLKAGLGGLLALVLAATGSALAGVGPLVTHDELERAFGTAGDDKVTWVSQVVTLDVLEEAFGTIGDKNATWTTQLVTRDRLEGDYDLHPARAGATQPAGSVQLLTAALHVLHDACDDGDRSSRERCLNVRQRMWDALADDLAALDAVGPGPSAVQAELDRRRTDAEAFLARWAPEAPTPAAAP